VEENGKVWRDRTWMLAGPVEGWAGGVNGLRHVELDRSCQVVGRSRVLRDRRMGRGGTKKTGARG